MKKPLFIRRIWEKETLRNKGQPYQLLSCGIYQEACAEELLEKATTGTDEPAGMMFYYDQPADMIMYGKKN